MNFFGREQILIPYTSDEITMENIGEIVQSIMPTVEKNSVEFVNLERYYRGQQDILDKRRMTETEASKNNIVVENHAYKIANFKTSYLIADGFKYSQDSDKSTNDVTFLNKYFLEENKVAKDTELALNMYIGGTGYKFFRPQPRKYKGVRRSPFNFAVLDNDKTFVAYSTDVCREKVLSGYYVPIKKDDKFLYQITVYTDEKVFTCESNQKFAVDESTLKSYKNVIGINPIVEYPLNKARLGAVEVVKLLLDSVNTIASNQVDNLVDFVNSLLVLYNIQLDPEKVKSSRALGTVAVTDVSPEMRAKIEYIAKQLNQAEINETRETLVRTAYEITGTPLTLTQASSGGDTGEARKLGDGYQGADMMINIEQSFFLASERESLEIELKICKSKADSEIDELYSGDIQINPTRHNTDNLMVKTQSLETLDRIGFPEEASLISVGLGSNPHELAMAWRARKEQNKSIIDSTKPKEDLGNGEFDDIKNPTVGDSKQATSTPTIEEI